MCAPGLTSSTASGAIPNPMCRPSSVVNENPVRLELIIPTVPVTLISLEGPFPVPKKTALAPMRIPSSKATIGSHCLSSTVGPLLAVSVNRFPNSKSNQRSDARAYLDAQASAEFRGMPRAVGIIGVERAHVSCSPFGDLRDAECGRLYRGRIGRFTLLALPHSLPLHKKPRVGADT
jgi:hypothetical protein